MAEIRNKRGNFLNLLFYAVSAEHGSPSTDRSLSQLYERMQQTNALWDPIENLLEGLHVTNSVWNAFDNAVGELAEAFEQQGFANGFRLGMMLRDELDVSKLDTRKERSTNA